MARGKSQGRRQIAVEVQGDHLERLAKCRPAAGLAELIWNGLDAEASNVEVTFRRNLLSGIEEISISDDGVGIGGEGYEVDTDDLFGKLGGSWKRQRRRTRSGRVFHGQAGEGRFKAFALGESVTWETRRLEAGKVVKSVISRSRGSREFTASEPVPTTEPTGTIVRISGVVDKPFPDSELVFDTLCQEFAPYLQQYQSVRIRFDGSVIDPQALILRTAELLPPITVEVEPGRTVSANLSVVEWSTSRIARALYFCDADGFALAEAAINVRARGFSFTAYLKSSYFAELKSSNLIDTDLAPGKEWFLDAARKKLQDYFRKRAAEEAADSVSQWQAEDIYPYHGVASSPIETVERQVFDIVALSVSDHLPDFNKSDIRQKRLTFQLLKQAVEENPESLSTTASSFRPRNPDRFRSIMK